MAATIVFVHGTPFPRYSGGVDTWLYNVIREVAKYNINVKLFAPKSRRPLFFEVGQFSHLELVETPPIEISPRINKWLSEVSRPLPSAPVACRYAHWAAVTGWRLWHHARRDKSAQIIVALNTLPALLPVVLYKAVGGKVRTACLVRGTLGDDLQEAGMPKLGACVVAAEKLLLSKIDWIATNGADTGEYLWKRMRVSAVSIPNGVDFSRFATGNAKGTEGDLAELKKDGVAMIVTTHTLRDVNGISFLIEAGNYLTRTLSRDYRIVFVGKGDKRRYEALAEQRMCGAKVIFVGEQRDVLPYLQLADVTVAVAGGGGVKHSLLEMMASGKPIVAWRNMTYSQVLTHGKSGHLVKERDAMALAMGIADVLENKEYARRLGAEAQQIAARYDWPVVVAEFLRRLSVVTAKTHNGSSAGQWEL